MTDTTNNIQDWHREAMTFVNNAIPLKESDLNGYKNLMLSALALESKAAYALFHEFGAEPTRSVLFRSAASIACNINEFDEAQRLVYAGLAGTPKFGVDYELRSLLYIIEKDRNDSRFMSNQYSQFLLYRENATHQKFELNKKTFGRAIPIKRISTYLRNYESAFQNYAFLDFQKNPDFEGQVGRDAIAKSLGELELLGVDFHFDGFALSISSNAVVSDHFASAALNSWRKDMFLRFQHDVLTVNFNKDDELQEIVEKFDAEERVLIYKPIIDTHKNLDLTTHITDDLYFNVEKTISPLNKQIREKVIPKQVANKPVESKVLIMQWLVAKEGAMRPSKPSDILQTTEADTASFTRQLADIRYSNHIIYLRQPIEYKLRYENPVWTIDDGNFQIRVASQNHEEAVNLYQEKFFQQYDRLKGMKKDILGEDDLQLLEVYKEIVFTDVEN